MYGTLRDTYSTDDLRPLMEPTRISDTPRTTLILIFVNNEHRIVKSGVTPVRLSDHYLVFCILKVSVHIKAIKAIQQY